AGATGRTAGREGRVVWIAGKAGQHRVNVVTEPAGKLGERRLRQNDAAGRTDLLHEWRVLGRVIVFPSLETRRHGQTDHVDVVLDDHQNAVQGADRPTCCPE